MFKKLKEKQSLINESRTALANAEKKIKDLSEQLRIAKHNELILIQRNHKSNDLIKRIIELVTCNTYNNEKVILNKIKELVRPQINTNSK